MARYHLLKRKRRLEKKVFLQRERERGDDIVRERRKEREGERERNQLIRSRAETNNSRKEHQRKRMIKNEGETEIGRE